MTQQAISQCGAPSASSLWSSINWQQVEDDVFRFQMRIAKVTKAQRWNKVRVLQRLLTRSHQAKLLAVRRVTPNRGRNTPGIDGSLWINPQQKMAGCSDPELSGLSGSVFTPYPHSQKER